MSSRPCIGPKSLDTLQRAFLCIRMPCLAGDALADLQHAIRGHQDKHLPLQRPVEQNGRSAAR
eukprot:6213214-Alexandrium_andersonii.AAC.1